MDNIRFILILALAMIGYMMWESWQIDYVYPKPNINTIELPTVDNKEELPINGNTQANNTIATDSSVPLAQVDSGKLIKVETDVFSLEIDTQGGTLRNLDLIKYPLEKENTVVTKLLEMIGVSPDETNLTPIRLLDSSVEKLFLAQSGLIAAANSASVPDHHQFFKAEKNNYKLAIGEQSLVIPLTWDNGQGLTVTKTLTFTRGSYNIQLSQTLNNKSNKPWTGRQYSQFQKRPYEEEKKNTFIRTYTGGVFYTEEDKYQKIDFEEMAEESLKVTTLGGWSGYIQHYFGALWVPPAGQENNFYSKELKDWRYVIGSYSPEITVAAGTQAELKAQLFVGPKIQPMMEKVSPGLELTVDYGWLTFFGKYIYAGLNWFNGHVQNWGLSILCVTFCIKLLFFPLSQASYRSMARMRKIHPKLKELKEEYADDRQRFNTEMMTMYKKEKVNPLGGCLPIMVQIPVFISLYWVLIETVELRQAPFLGWLEDLSAQDPFFILPILYGITMKIQQSLNPPPIDPVQARVMQMFPIMFTFFFLFFPSGLVLYWICNNTLSIIQQWFITKRIAAETN
ncbi:MAG: membrane protein insertase YidC [Methylococcales bacterium]|nr:membrane protein insertase YidC [Methylococcales bacterium]